MIDNEHVFDAVRRGYNALEGASADEIYDYFESIDSDSVGGHVSNIKGILFEQEYVRQLADEGITAQIFEATNHPVTDISIIEDGVVINELQLKATENVSYINATLENTPDIEIVTTTEVAQEFIGNETVIDSGIGEQALEDSILEVVSPVSPLSIIGWFFGWF